MRSFACIIYMVFLVWATVTCSFTCRTSVWKQHFVQNTGRAVIRPTLPTVRHSACGHSRSHQYAANNDGTSVASSAPTIRMELVNINKLFFRASWLSWWAQIILSVVSSVILTFANAVRPVGTKVSYLWISGVSFSSVGVLLALMNSFWTWNVTRLCRRISLRKVQENKVAVLLKRYSQISVAISLVGMTFSLLGAEQIVGTLASKMLSSGGGYAPFMAPSLNTMNGIAGLGTTPIQAVDIFLVQANTNSMLAHFSSLLCYILLQTRLSAIVAK